MPPLAQDLLRIIISVSMRRARFFACRLYLESHLAPGVFTPARITVLKLVASLAVSALENSHLLRDLQEQETKAKRLVDANIIGIYVVDIRGPILESTDAYLRKLAYERGDLVSRVMNGKVGFRDADIPSNQPGKLPSLDLGS